MLYCTVQYCTVHHSGTSTLGYSVFFGSSLPFLPPRYFTVVQRRNRHASRWIHPIWFSVFYESCQIYHSWLNSSRSLYDQHHHTRECSFLLQVMSRSFSSFTSDHVNVVIRGALEMAHIIPFLLIASLSYLRLAIKSLAEPHVTSPSAAGLFYRHASCSRAEVSRFNLTFSLSLHSCSLQCVCGWVESIMCTAVEHADFEEAS